MKTMRITLMCVLSLFIVAPTGVVEQNVKGNASEEVQPLPESDILFWPFHDKALGNKSTGHQGSELLGEFYEKWRQPYNRRKRPGQRDEKLRPECFEESCTVQSFGDSVRTAWVSHYASGLMPGPDMATAMAVDQYGNVYVTGRSPNPPCGDDFLTVKYDSTGGQIWTASYNGEANRDDCVWAIVVDPSCNVYVCGWSEDSNGNSDIATIKYDSSGVQQWVIRYNGLDDRDDRAIAIGIDGARNVYVTGTSESLNGGEDYVTIRYNSHGFQEWVARYNGPGNSYDGALAQTVDDNGNVHVTGYSEGLGTEYDYATVKYNSSGVEQWVSRFNGLNNKHDIAMALDVDKEDNVYVTGWSEGSESGYDYATVKYNSTGIEQWTIRYNGSGNSDDRAYDVAADDFGSIYVTGTSGGEVTGDDYVTIKYSADGVQQWTTRFNGEMSIYDYALALAIDGKDNIYVTGNSWNYISGSDYVTIQYNSDGIEQWVSHYNGSPDCDYADAMAFECADDVTALAVDGKSHVYVTGYSKAKETGYDFATVQYDSDGVQQWVSRYVGPGEFKDHGTAIAVDSWGHVIVTGYSEGPGTKEDYATIRYNPDGGQDWVVRYDGPGNSYDRAYDIEADDDGNVYITGYSEGEGTGRDFATIKYNAAGHQEWVDRYDGPAGGWDETFALAIDASSNVYVSGRSAGGTGDDIATIKYGSDGVREWIARYDGGDDASEMAYDVAVDDSGNVMVAGYNKRPQSHRDFITVKYNSLGEEQWAADYMGSDESDDVAYAIGVDRHGNIYVTGFTNDDDTYFDIATVKYSSSGVEQWVARYNGPDNGLDWAHTLSVDDWGNVYVAGKSDGDVFTTIKYNTDGIQQWVACYRGSGSYDNEAFAIAVDGYGNVYVTGRSDEPDTGSDFVTIKYNSAGMEQWVARYDGYGDSDAAKDLIVDDSGNVYVTGYSLLLDYTTYTTIKYVQTLVSVTQDETVPHPASFLLSQNDPNPFNPATTISYQLSAFSGQNSTHTTLKIYNILGQEVATLVDEVKEPGYYSVTWNATDIASGVYFYRLTVGDGEWSQTKRMVLMR